MPPKKRIKEPIQTKLTFKPISQTNGTASLFTTISPTTTTTPLRSTIPSLEKRTSAPSFGSSSPWPSTTNRSATSPSLSLNNATRSNEARPLFSELGGKKDQQNTNHSDRDPFSTGDMSKTISTEPSSWTASVSQPELLSESSLELSQGIGKDDVLVDESKSSRLAAKATSEINIGSTKSVDKDFRKRKAPLDFEDEGNSFDSSLSITGSSPIAPVMLESDSEDELLRMPQSQQPPSSQPDDHSSDNKLSKKEDIPTSTDSAAPRRSLLDQMATPRGTKPIPRSTELLNPKSNVGYNAAAKLATTPSSSNLPPRPRLVSSNSNMSDDGFVSGSSLEARMQGRFGGQGPELLPPTSRQPPNTTTNGSQQGSSLYSKVQSYSHKRASDFTSFSKGGGGVGAGGAEGGVNTSQRSIASGVPGRKLPSTVNRLSPALSRSPSFNQSQDARSRSSSPVAGQPTTAIITQEDEKRGNRTKDGLLLSEEQLHVLGQVINFRQNVFFTGSAGTGKSVLLREIIARLRQRHQSHSRDSWESSASVDAVAVTASTGIAACNIGGCTLHSFAGAGLGVEALPVLQSRIQRNGNTMRRWRETQVLIIDEVSMVDADFMDKLEALARFTRKSQLPWGGMQVVLTGDFFQLPPVSRSGNAKFCFESQSWTQTINLTVELKQVFRQKDPTFANMLNDMRLGIINPQTEKLFKTLSRELANNDGLRPTELFPLRNQVEDANNRMLHNLTGKSVFYEARDRGPSKDKMEQNCLAPTKLHLKLNAQVMLLRNQGGGSGGLVNGSIGVLIGFSTRTADNDQQIGPNGERRGSLNSPGEELPHVRFTLEDGTVREMIVGREEWKLELPNGDLLGARVQIPLGLAWSLSIHKSQGQTLPKVRVDLGKVFEKGQAYVALSRAVSLDGLQVLNFDPRRVMVHPKVTEFYKKLQVYNRSVGRIA